MSTGREGVKAPRVPKYQEPPEVTRVGFGQVTAFWTVPTKPIYRLCCWGVQCEACGWRASGYTQQGLAELNAARHAETCAAARHYEESADVA